MSSDLSQENILNAPILITDDSAITRRKLSSDLIAEGFTNIYEADCAEKTLEMITEIVPAIFLVDMLMPGMDGSELVKELRDRPLFSQTPIIIITVSEEKTLVQECFRLGANDFLRKPWDSVDLTARVQAQIERSLAIQALHLSEKRFSQAMEASRDGLWEFDHRTGRGYFSPGFYRMLGHKPGSFSPTMEVFESLIHPDDASRAKQLLQSFYRTRREHFELEYRMQNRSGGWNWICSRGSIVEREEDGSPRKSVGVNEDITSQVMIQKTLQKYATEMEQLAAQRAQALIHSERLATIGTMSAGIAHEINNPLGYISGNAQMVQKVWPDIEGFILPRLKEAQDPEKMAFILEQLPGAVESITEGVQRIVGIVKSMKDFSRKEVQQMQKFDVCEAIDNSLLLCHNALKYNFEVVKNYQTGKYIVSMRHQQIEQVLVNLINNAVQAMGTGGRLIFEAKQIGEYVSITIDDTGPGIPDDVLPKIFDAFFTTKGEDIGTGLGLSISKGIMQEHGGSIEAENLPTRGARFTLMLPQKDTPMPQTNDDNQPRVLLVEDDPTVRDKISERLLLTGCQLLNAASVSEAKRHLRFSRPHAVILSLSYAGIRKAAPLLKLRHDNLCSAPIFIISSNPASQIAQETGSSEDDFHLIPTLNSAAIGMIYSSAIDGNE